jgi:hypothetical protein
MRLWEALGGSGRLWEALGPALRGSGKLKEALGGSGRLWEALGGFGNHRKPEEMCLYLYVKMAMSTAMSNFARRPNA